MTVVFRRVLFHTLHSESLSKREKMPLGIDRTHFYAEKVKKQEKDIRVSISKSCTIFLEEP